MIRMPGRFGSAAPASPASRRPATPVPARRRSANAKPARAAWRTMAFPPEIMPLSQRNELSALRPDRQLVAVGIEEVEPAPAGKLEDRPGNAAAGGFDPRLQICKIVAVEVHERAARPRRHAGGEPALQPAIGEFAIGRPVVGERPSERATVERL